METIVDLPQPGFEHMCVDLRRREVGVAEHGLDGAEVGAALEQVRRERVTQDVRAEMTAHTGGESVLLQQLPEPEAGEPCSTAGVDEQPRTLPLLAERGAAL